MSAFADAFDGKAKPKPATTKRCLFCGLALYIPNLTKHPCCYFAEAAGHDVCAGCMAFEAREKKPKKRGR